MSSLCFFMFQEKIFGLITKNKFHIKVFILSSLYFKGKEN